MKNLENRSSVSQYHAISLVTVVVSGKAERYPEWMF